MCLIQNVFFTIIYPYGSWKSFQLRMIVKVETTTSEITTKSFIGPIKSQISKSPILILHRWRANQFCSDTKKQLTLCNNSKLNASII